jgi:uroporphyrinogen decarboxylase
MYGDPELWHALCERLASITSAFLRVQIEAGASAIQLFDSWAGALSEADYRTYVQPHSARVLGGLAEAGVPRIHFGVGTGELLTLMADAGADVIGVDWRVPLDIARRRVGDKAVQGNLDPASVLAPWAVTEAEARKVLASNGGRAGHIFNLGWGVRPETDPDQLKRLVDLVHGET